MKKLKLKKGSLTGLIIGIALSIALFFVLTFLQREMLKDTEKTVTVLANKTIDAGMVLTKENASAYLKEVEINSSLATTETYQTIDELIGKYVTRTIKENEIIYSGQIGDEEEILRNYENPIELSLTISDDAAAVAGTIRKGDYVNVYAYLRGENGVQLYELVLEDVLINEAYNSETVKIEMSDKESVALTFTFYMEQEDVPELLNKLETKEIFIVKVK